MKISMYTLGCKVNQYESDSLAEVLKQRGHTIVSDYSQADMFIVNTCAVTSEAEKKSRQTLAKLQSYSKSAKIIVCGCASQHNLTQFKTRDNVTVINGTANKNSIADLIDSVSYELNTLPIAYEEIAMPIPTRTRTYVKIQDGCNSYCTYCIIPFLRGRSRSRDIQSVLNECNTVSNEVKEIVITGINISDYGLDIGTNLIELLKKLSGVKARIRLGSLEQHIITDEFLTVVKSMPNFCPHFHLSMQSGSTAVLKKMNRRYTAEDYIKKIELVRKYFPYAFVATDIIVGFPTETEEQFMETVETVKKAEFTTIHIFPYSQRTGTPAAKFKQIEPSVKYEREARLEKIEKEYEEKFLKNNIGREETVLIEHGGEPHGYTSNYIMTYLEGTNLKEDDLVKVRLTQLYKDGMKAVLI